MTIHGRVKVKAGGVVELAHPALREGSEAEVVVTVEPPVDRADNPASPVPLWQRIVEIGASVPDEEWAKVPADLSQNLDHYLYGSPKEDEA